MSKKQIVDVFRVALRNWRVDSMPIRAAALTFFIILPLPSLLLIVVNVFSLFYGQTQALQLLTEQISNVAGPAIADLFEQLLGSALSPFMSIWTAVTILAFSIGGAIGAFAVLRDIMDVIWGYKVKRPRSVFRRIRLWIGPFALVSSLGLIVIASTAIATGLFGLIRQFLGSGYAAFITSGILQIVFSFLISTLLFAIIYKVIPLATVHWRDVSLAAVVAGIAFTITNYIIGTYVATFTVTTIIGTAGALFIILLWIFIVNQIALYGAEVSKVYATTVGMHAKQHITYKD